MSINLSDKSYEELQTLHENLLKEMAAKKKSAQLEGIQKIRAIAKQFDLTVTIEEEATVAKRTMKPKYRNPDTGETWSGYGGTARWIKEFEKQGRNRDEFLIQE